MERRQQMNWQSLVIGAGAFFVDRAVSSAGEMLSPLKYGGFLRAVEYKGTF